MKTTFHFPTLTIASAAMTAAALLAAVSCTDDSGIINPETGGDTITFRVTSATSRSGEKGVTTGHAISMKTDGNAALYLIPEISETTVERGESRSDIIDASTIEDFGVYAYLSNGGETYMDDVKITRQARWTPADEYLWPGENSLKFIAYSPYGTPVSIDGGEHIIDYTTPADVSDQHELLWATPVEASASPCALTFNHALTAIRFVTGAEMKPCTVKRIELSDIPSTGRLDISTGTWSDVTTPTTFAIEPAAGTLTAAAGSDYVAPSTPITADDETLLLIPGKLGDNAGITMTVESAGKEFSFTASLAGQIWEAGKTVTYHLSATPGTDGLVLDVIGTFRTEYPGQTFPFLVRSAMISADGDSVPVSWKAEFVDNDNNIIDCPDWILRFPTQGDGHDDCTASTRMQDLTFVKLSKESQILQDTPDVNTTSGQNPYNLSNSTGAPAVENTANCYIVNAPGTYSLPLVYGNAIKDGIDNKDAYTASTHTRQALKTFVNHLNKGITSPYIYDNAGCTPSDAVLVWEGRLDLIRDVALTPDHRSITFMVPAQSIRQGSAMIAVRDADGTVMWSWQIWVTDYNPSNDIWEFTADGKTHKAYSRNIGRITGGDITVFPKCTVKIRFTQTGDIPDGKEPLSKTVEFIQTGTTTETTDCYSFYQWGRKDPIKSNLNEWFDAAHYRIPNLRTMPVPTGSLTEEIETTYIKNPDIYFTADHNMTFKYTNLWDSSLSATAPVKTIYDPSPVGSRVPYDDGFRSLTIPGNATVTDGTTAAGTPGFQISPANGTTTFFPALGYRSGSSANDASAIGVLSTIWLAHATTNSASDIVLGQSSLSIELVNNPRTHGFGVRPVIDE